jgi:hypothetical protein
MLWKQIMLAFCGVSIIALGLGNYLGAKGRLFIYRHIVDETDGETLRKYQRAIFPPYALLGLGFITFAIAVPYIRDPQSARIAAVAAIAVFLAAVIWLVVCNKKHLGRFTGPNFRELFK